MNLKIFYEDNHLLVVEKPINMPICEDESKDLDLLSYCKQYLKEKYNKQGNVYLGLVHRLDRPVGGVVVFAKTSKAASRLSEAVRLHKIKKEYIAVLDGIPKNKNDELVDYLIKDHKHNKVTTTDKTHGKESSLNYEVIEEKDNKTLVLISLKTGRSHQIRVQFSSRNLPLVYDQRYNPKTTKGQIALYAYRLTFPHPITKKDLTITGIVPNRYPFNLFKNNNL